MNDGKLADTMMAALAISRTMREQGQSKAEIDAYLEQVLRAAWPKGRTWKYLCEDCFDTGLAMRECRPGSRCNGISTRMDTAHDTPGKYTRHCAMPGSEQVHDYGEPCFCSRGSRFRPPEKTGEDFTTATKAKPRPMTRFGR